MIAGVLLATTALAEEKKAGQSLKEMEIECAQAMAKGRIEKALKLFDKRAELAEKNGSYTNHRPPSARQN